MIPPQFLIDTGTGAMKSLISDVNEVEERDFTYAEENDSQAPCVNRPAASMLIAASPNCCAGRSTARLPPSVSLTVEELVAPSKALALSAVSGPQLEPCQNAL